MRSQAETKGPYPMHTKAEIAAAIDHAILKPCYTDADVRKGCALARQYQVASVCVRPGDVALAVREMHGAKVPVGTVVGFPHGSNRSEVKALETRLAIEDGATEIDMVMQIGAFLSGRLEETQKDIESVVSAARPSGACVKVILETCWLSPEQIAEACRLCRKAGADYVKTSTGFGAGSATPDAVAVMLDAVGDALGVKASGGIRDAETASFYLDQGCRRLGVGDTAAVLEGAPE